MRETRGWVREADPCLAGEAEEVAQRRQSEAAIATRGEELLDVTARARRLVGDAGAVQVRGEPREDREALLDRVIGERVLADPAGAFATGQQPREVSLGRGAQRRWAALDPARASAVSRRPRSSLASTSPRATRNASSSLAASPGLRPERPPSETAAISATGRSIPA